MWIQIRSFIRVGIFLLFFGMVGYSYHMQLNGHQYEREECWKIGGILWHTMSGKLICIKVPQEKTNGSNN